MDFEPGYAILAGLIGGTAMAAILYMGILMLPQQMKMNLFAMLGTMVLPAGAAAFVMGGMVHAVMSIVFGLVHGAVFAATDIDSGEAVWGLLFGLVHWVIVGMALGMLPLMHRGIRDGEIDAPGFYALNYPPMTVMGFLMLHLVFGVIVGALYGSWAG
ncbi:MAG: hypothetical protein IIC86_03505 [Chloroflexi bacterium]|nr:hypothetical protein [Chloroflexota bacterium]